MGQRQVFQALGFKVLLVFAYLSVLQLGFSEKKNRFARPPTLAGFLDHIRKDFFHSNN